MVQKYYHTFQDGLKIAVAVDLSVTPPLFVSDTIHIPKKYREEYEKWVDEVIVEDILPRLNAAQLAYVCKRGAEEKAKQFF